MSLTESTSPLSAFRIPNDQTFSEAGFVEIVDQLLLPHEIRWERVETVEGAYDAIKTMRIRGAPAIASLASLGIASELLKVLKKVTTLAFTSDCISDSSAFKTQLLKSTSYLLSSRPTAVNLREAMQRIEQCAETNASDEPQVLIQKVIDAAIKVWSEDKERNHQIGDNGAKWILEKLERQGRIQPGQPISVLTVCNTGSLATSGYGTALGVIASLQSMGRLEHAYFAQTGPYQQGARLTSLELASLGTKNTMVCDTAIGALIAEKKVDLFVAGADRIASNGDTANKISTYQISLQCKHPHPFSPNQPVSVLVAAPLTTLDLNMQTGREIVIEQRPSIEACTVRGRVVTAKGEKDPSEDQVRVETVLVTPPGTNAWNPAFDVTPAGLIDGIVTEVGVATKSEGQDQFDLSTFVKQHQA